MLTRRSFLIRSVALGLGTTAISKGKFARAAEARTFTFGHDQPADTAYGFCAEQFDKKLAELSGGTGEGVLQKSGRREGRGGGGIPFMIEGTTANPKFVPDVKGMASGAAQQAISGKINPKGESPTKGLGGALKKRF